MLFSWAKGHGTENDFLVLPDHDGHTHGVLAPDFVAALCHRRSGIGADGILRVVSAQALAEIDPDVAAIVADEHWNASAEWFMDYRNADGSVAQMCGNGARVFVRYLVEEGLVSGAEEFAIGTRDGTKQVRFDGELISVDMGDYRVGQQSKVATLGRAWEAQEIHTGNPHAVAFVDRLSDVGNLSDAPEFDRAVFPDGVNVEFVRRVAPKHISMRVHERGAGETRSCGTGACAAAITASLSDAPELPVQYRVDVPGGTLYVTIADNGRTTLTGPAAIVARGQLRWTA